MKGLMGRRGPAAGGAEGAGAAAVAEEAAGVVKGAEGEGMRRLTRESCDLLVRIPMQGEVQSLNVSVAAGVCLFESVRRRGGGHGRVDRG